LSVSPKFTEPSALPIDKIFSTEEKFLLSCQIQEYVYPKAVVTWYKYEMFRKRINISDGEILIKTGLSIENDSGTYMCEASNHPNGKTIRKTFLVEIFIPARCDVSPSSINVQAGKTVTVNLAVGGTPKPTYTAVDPWTLAISDGRVMTATSSFNTSGDYTIIKVVQNVNSGKTPRQTKTNCTLTVTIQMTSQVCLLMKEIGSYSRCSTRAVAEMAQLLSNRMQKGVHILLGCSWNISVHYVFTTGKANCTTLEYGVTVVQSSNIPCLSPPSLTSLRDAITSWTNSQTYSSLSITYMSANTDRRIYCRKIREIQIRLPMSCSSHMTVHVLCKSDQGIVRLCAWCNRVGSKCTKIDAALRRAADFIVLHPFCF
jgi:hypothetical protein